MQSRQNSLSPWLMKSHPRQGSQRLFCFHHAGGNASLYHHWSDKFPEEIEVLRVQLPGRGSRMFEPCLTTMPEILDGLCDALVSELRRAPFSFFGHSMGGLVAYEFARRLLKEGLQPLHLFVSGVRGPSVFHSQSRRRYSQLSDGELVEDLRKLGGTPSEMLENRELLDLVLPIIRADYQVIDEYEFSPEPVLSIPIHALGGEGDEETPETTLQAWAERTHGAFRLKMYPGDHFYLQAEEDRVTQEVIDQLLHR